MNDWSRDNGYILYVTIGLGTSSPPTIWAMPLRDKGGELLGFVKIMRDLTESKRAQEAMQEQLEELTRFNVAAVGRETRMIELKKEINDLCDQLGLEHRYKIEADRRES